MIVTMLHHRSAILNDRLTTGKKRAKGEQGKSQKDSHFQ